MKMNNELLNKYQKLINYENADNMFNALDNLLKNNDRNFILNEDHDSEKECVNSYILRTSVIRYAWDAIEHYSKAILIQKGSTWNESKSFGHNLLALFNNLDDETRTTLFMSLISLNEFDYKKMLKIDNLYRREIEITELCDLLNKNHLIDNLNYNNLDALINCREVIINNYNNYNNLSTSTHMPFCVSDENIKPLNNSSIEGELKKLNAQQVPHTSKQQLLGIKSRFPGQYLVEGNAEFLISLAYALNKISKYYKKKNQINYRK